MVATSGGILARAQNVLTLVQICKMTRNVPTRNLDVIIMRLADVET